MSKCYRNIQTEELKSRIHALVRKKAIMCALVKRFCGCIEFAWSKYLPKQNDDSGREDQPELR